MFYAFYVHKISEERLLVCILCFFLRVKFLHKKKSMETSPIHSYIILLTNSTLGIWRPAILGFTWGLGWSSVIAFLEYYNFDWYRNELLSKLKMLYFITKMKLFCDLGCLLFLQLHIFCLAPIWLVLLVLPCMKCLQVSHVFWASNLSKWLQMISPRVPFKCPGYL